MAHILQYIDFIWLPLVFLAAPKPHRRTALLYVLGCIFLLRMQVEMMIALGYPRGILTLVDMSAFNRGLVIYTLFYILYLGFLHFSAKNDKSIVMASSIGLYFVVFFVSSMAMVL
ncbi:MAG: hypothetical protein KDJ35_04040 [Alphaproteobacteria bacterium]|nr:hypothetical protein [Alphaproteobacteria bacterium]